MSRSDSGQPDRGVQVVRSAGGAEPTKEERAAAAAVFQMISGIHIQLPAATRLKHHSIAECEWRLRTFVERDAYVNYDYWIQTRSAPPDTITRDHVYAINNAMRARSPLSAWDGLLGQRLSTLATIPEDLDLVTGSSEAVEAGLRALADLVSWLTERKGLTDMAVSKVLYLMRPRFVAVSDSYVRTSLGVLDSRITQSASSPAFYAVRMDRVQRAMREIGQANEMVMDHLYTFANSLPPVVPLTGPFRGSQIPIELSRVRILDILLWTDVAIRGETPHPEWTRRFDERAREY
jgi:hypothetical protein